MVPVVLLGMDCRDERRLYTEGQAPKIAARHILQLCETSYRQWAGSNGALAGAAIPTSGGRSDREIRRRLHSLLRSPMKAIRSGSVLHIPNTTDGFIGTHCARRVDMERAWKTNLFA